MNKPFFILFSHNIPVKGKERSAIYDLQQEAIHFIPNVLIEIIDALKQAPVSEVKQAVAPNQPEIIDKYLAFLQSKNLGFYTDTPHLFNQLSLEWKSPEIIQSAVIEYCFKQYDIKAVISQLEELHCKHIELRLVSEADDESKMIEIFESIKNTMLRSVSLICAYTDFMSFGFMQHLVQQHPKITDVLVHSSPYHGKDKKYPERICYVKQGISSYEKNYKEEFKPKYIVNTSFFTESLKHNAFHNKKVCIDDNGDIKNSINYGKSFGNVKTHLIKDVLEFPEFKEWWYAAPDNIEGVCDSPLRYCMILDAPLKKLENGRFTLTQQ